MKNLLIIGCGLACSGKSTFFKELARRNKNLVYIDKDVINNSFISEKNFSNDKNNSEFYDKNIKVQTYRAMFGLAKDNLILKKSVILDGYFADKLETPLFKELLEMLNGVDYKLITVKFYCTKDVLFKRMKNRNFWRDYDKLLNKKSFDNYYDSDSKYLNSSKFDFVLNTEKTTEELIENFKEAFKNDFNNL